MGGAGLGQSTGFEITQFNAGHGEICSCPLTPVVSKASAGAMEVMDLFSTDDLAGFLQVMAGRGTVGREEMSQAQSLQGHSFSSWWKKG